MLEYYCIPEYDDVQEFLSHLAKKTGKLKKGGIPDLEAAAKSVLRDWNMLVSYLCLPQNQLILSILCLIGVVLNFTRTPLRSGPFLAMCLLMW